MFAGAGWNRGDKSTGRVATSKNGVKAILRLYNQFTILLAQLLLAKASGLALKAKPIPNM